eukprot:Blabericola_migrator_1__6163@NODE_3109_length_2030_cov_61_461029_g1946_i0_p1_GENE_NODE_3109_length_2030_cov_61_461029_g1946_i0NODE_3109_length_2030_cov_61_461029_g1946_i0_p1_ORF_typecomplete_len260_score32_69Phage_antitermQ/PF06530_12/0_12_NODE_3109_length_2030_cov_61_461029_g1946_i077856
MIELYERSVPPFVMSISSLSPATKNFVRLSAMNARAASVVVQQAQQQARAQHDTKARFLFSGLILGLRSVLVGIETGVLKEFNPDESSCGVRFWRTDVFDYEEFYRSDGRRYGETLIERGVLVLHEDTWQLSESSPEEISVRDLVTLNNFLDFLIAESMKKAAQLHRSNTDWHKWAAELLPQWGKWVRDSPDEAVAGARLQRLVAVKSKLLQSPKLSPSEADALKSIMQNASKEIQSSSSHCDRKRRRMSFFSVIELDV